MSAQKVGDAFVQIALRGAALVTKQIEDLKKRAEKQQKTGTGDLSPGMMAFAGGAGAFAAIKGIQALQVAITGLTKSIIKMQDELLQAIMRLSNLQKTASRIGVSSTWLSIMRVMVADSNMTMAEFEQSVAAMQRNIETFSQGVGESRQTLVDLGISPEDFASWKTIDEKFINLIRHFATIEDVSKRAGAEQRVLGEQGRKLIPLVEGNEALYRVLQKQARFLGMGHAEEGIKRVDELRDSTVKMTMQFDALWEKLAIMLAPSLQNIINYTIAFIKTMYDLGSAISTVEQSGEVLSVVVGELGRSFRVWGEGGIVLIGQMASAFLDTASMILTVASDFVDVLAVMTAYQTMITGDDKPLMAIAALSLELEKASKNASSIATFLRKESIGFRARFDKNLAEWTAMLNEELNARRSQTEKADEVARSIKQYADVFRGEALGRSASTMQRLAEKQVSKLTEVKREVAELRKDLKSGPVIGVAE